jgi:hypothetical protein
MLLAAATFLLWQYRFERIGAPLNATFSQQGAGWDVTGEGVAFHKEGTATTVVLTRSSNRPVPEVSRTLDAQAQRYVWIGCDVAARDLRAGREAWQLGRVACYGVDQAGKGMFKREHVAIAARGTQPWRSAELVFELDPRMQQVRVTLQNHGNSGEFAVRRFDVAYVRDRPALAWQAPLLLAGWIVWLMLLMHRGLGASAPAWRCAAGAALPLALVWVLALPGIGTTARPLGLHRFFGTAAPGASGLISGAANPAETQVFPRTAESNLVPAVNHAPAASTVESKPPPVPRRRPWLEWISRTWDPLHAVVFFGLTFVLLLLTRARNVWWVSASVVALIQGIEWLQYGALAMDDLVEVLWAAAGIASALWLWRRLRPQHQSLVQPPIPSSADS